MSPSLLHLIQSSIQLILKNMYYSKIHLHTKKYTFNVTNLKNHLITPIYDAHNHLLQLMFVGGPNSCLQILGQQSVLQLIKPLKTHTDVRLHIVVVSHAAEILVLINAPSTYPIQLICTLFITIPLVYLNVLVYLFFLVSCVCSHFSFLMLIYAFILLCRFMI